LKLATEKEISDVIGSSKAKKLSNFTIQTSFLCLPQLSVSLFKPFFLLKKKELWSLFFSRKIKVLPSRHFTPSGALDYLQSAIPTILVYLFSFIFYAKHLGTGTKKSPK
jgi:hypothetical protein